MAMKRSPTVVSAWIGGTALIVATLVTVLWPPDGKERSLSESAQSDAQTKTLFEGFVLDSRFFPSGWMGDGKYGTRYLSVQPVSTDVYGEQKMALRIVYSFGPEGWAGLYWQYPDGNWGEQPGLSLIGARQISFLARGTAGGEVVEFKAGGIRGHFSDSFEKSLGKVALTQDWKTYRIDLEGEDLGSVIGGFAWSAPATPNTPLSFWLADLQVR